MFISCTKWSKLVILRVLQYQSLDKGTKQPIQKCCFCTACQHNSLSCGLVSPVNIISKEEVVCLWRKASILKQPQQVCVLPVDVAWNRIEGHTFHLDSCVNPPQILRGASSSRRIGCCRKSSLDFKQRPRTWEQNSYIRYLTTQPDQLGIMMKSLDRSLHTCPNMSIKNWGQFQARSQRS